MKKILTGMILFALFALRANGGLYGQDSRTSPITVNLIVDGSAALAGVLDEVSAWVSGSLLDRIVQNGDRVAVWSAGEKAQLVFSDTIAGGESKEAVKKALAAISAGGDAADFTGALRDAASRSSGGGITYTLLISASPAALSPTLLGPEASRVKYSRIEEFPRWRAMVIALDIDSRVRRAASAWLSEAS
jgi:hypothetical protein